MESTFKKSFLLCLLALLFFMTVAIAQEYNSANLTTSRYIDNGNFTVTDKSTGLMWKKYSECGSYIKGQAVTTNHDWSRLPWELAQKWCVQDRNNSGGFAGYTDWRIPNIHELYSIYEERRNYNRSAPAINIDAFPNSPKGEFWSSSPYDPDENGDAKSFFWQSKSDDSLYKRGPCAWALDFYLNDNRPIRMFQDEQNYVRLVRGQMIPLKTKKQQGKQPFQ